MFKCESPIRRGWLIYVAKRARIGQPRATSSRRHVTWSLRFGGGGLFMRLHDGTVAPMGIPRITGPLVLGLAVMLVYVMCSDCVKFQCGSPVDVCPVLMPRGKLLLPIFRFRNGGTAGIQAIAIVISNPARSHRRIIRKGRPMLNETPDKPNHFICRSVTAVALQSVRSRSRPPRRKGRGVRPVRVASRLPVGLALSSRGRGR